MPGNIRVIVLVLFLMFFLPGAVFAASNPSPSAESVEQAGVSASKTVLLKQPVPVYRLELASEALAVWRQYATQRPTLLMLSNDPMLQRVQGEETTRLADPVNRETPLLLGDAPVLELTPNRVGDEVSRQADSASREELRHLTYYGQPAPLFLPGMTLDIALRKGWFQKLYWVFPSDGSQPMTLEALTIQFEKTGFADATELASLSVTGQVAQGVLREVPMTMAALANLDTVTGPVVLHIDQSYFQKMYINEIATPLLELVMETLSDLRKRQIPVLAVTFANGNLDGRISLNVRFLQEIVSELIENPDMLEKPFPVNWQRKAQTLYLENFFKTEEINTLALMMSREEPASAWAKFTLYLSAIELNQARKALSYLAEAVSLDQIYALEYLRLSEMAYEKGFPDEALRMLSLAADVFPDNSQIQLNMAQLAAEIGDTETALHLVKQLQKLNWSPIYYAEMPEYLEGFALFLEESEEASAPKTDADVPAADPKRQRILN